jgi:RNA polymerase sigma-70 factor (ECF subfamily)
MEMLKERPPSVNEQDDRLIERLRMGDVEAFEAFYKAYRPRLRGFILNITANEHAVDEVFDDVMMVVWNKIGDFEGRSKLSTWVFSIAYRRAIKARCKRQDVEYSDHIEQPGLCEGDAERAVEAGRAQDRIRTALGKLPADQEAVIRLAYFEGLSYRTISAIMECPPETVKTRMFHARRKLKAALGGILSDWL